MTNLPHAGSSRTFAELLTETLAELGYTHCFLLPGGAIMHLVEAARRHMTCIPVIHENSAVIAAEYFNQVSQDSKAYALVTAGPGVTNAATGVAGAFLESRDVLVIAGQVKSDDLANGQVRQRGIQEVDGVELLRSISICARRLTNTISVQEIQEVVVCPKEKRRGPVYLEVCLDVQGQSVSSEKSKLDLYSFNKVCESASPRKNTIDQLVSLINQSERPVILMGGGVQHATIARNRAAVETLQVPLMTTWNGFDRIGDNFPSFAGRPNTWGQRSANILLAQSDLVVALGTRLGLQQTGFNWRSWGPQSGEGSVIQVDLDTRELLKGHPKVDLPLALDANEVLIELLKHDFVVNEVWRDHIDFVRNSVPLVDSHNVCRSEYISPYAFVESLSAAMGETDVLIPGSSGAANFVLMQTFMLKFGQRLISNKGLASMGYGLGGALGTSFATDSRIVLVEGDGSLMQSLPELASTAMHNRNLKIFLFDNDGYASIRQTQRNYFGGAYVACDRATGLAVPDWAAVASSLGMRSQILSSEDVRQLDRLEAFEDQGAVLFVLKVDPQQTYFPKVTSKVSDSGGMQSNPIHLMHPPLPIGLAREVFRFRPSVVKELEDGL